VGLPFSMALMMDQFGVSLCVSINGVFSIQFGFGFGQGFFAIWTNSILTFPFQFFEFAAHHRFAALVVTEFFRNLPPKSKEQFAIAGTQVL